MPSGDVQPTPGVARRLPEQGIGGYHRRGSPPPPGAGHLNIMRLILTVNYSPWSRYCGGGQHATHRLAEALARRGHRVSVVYTKPPWERVAAPAGLPYDIRWAAFCALRSNRTAPFRVFNAWTVAGTVAAILADEPVDIVHSQGEEGALLPRLRARRGGFHVVVTARYPTYPRGAGGRWLLSPKYRSMAHLVRHADARCTTSNASRALLSRAFTVDARETHVVPNGVDPIFSEVTRGMSARHGPIVFFGRIERSKGVDTLIEALSRLRDAIFLPVLVIGRGSWERAARQSAARLGLTDRIEFRGWLDRDALASTLATARLAVLPSREESFGNVMVEAMAAGVPVLSTSVGSVPEVTDNGQAARLVPADDPDQLAHAISDLVRYPDETEALGEQGRAFVAREFSWPRAASHYERIYMTLSHTGRRGRAKPGATE
jgi:glycosyltransferase involved in cell wall biosynthesis